MAHPKRRQSSTRRDKRRTHYKAAIPSLTTDPTTGEMHVRHKAHWSDGKLYYRGKVVLEKETEEFIED
jgi:large subunit ribosomal protein L32